MKQVWPAIQGVLLAVGVVVISTLLVVAVDSLTRRAEVCMPTHLNEPATHRTL